MARIRPIKEEMKLKIGKPKEAYHIYLSYWRAYREGLEMVIQRYGFKPSPAMLGTMMVIDAIQREYGYFEKIWVINAFLDLHYRGAPTNHNGMYIIMRKLKKQGMIREVFDQGERFTAIKWCMTLRGEEFIKIYTETLNKYLKDWGGLRETYIVRLEAKRNTPKKKGGGSNKKKKDE